MQAGVGPGHKAAATLVTAPSSGVKAVDPLLQGPFDRRVVADLEVEAVDLLLAAPVATPQLVAVLHTHRHRHRIAGVTAMGGEQHHLIPVQISQGFKKSFFQVLAAPRPPAGAVLLIKAVHSLQQRQIQLLPREWRHHEPGLGDRLALPLDVAALVGVEALQVILKPAVVPSAPQALLVQPSGTTSRLRQRTPLGIHIEKIAAEDVVLLAEQINDPQHFGGEGCFVFPGTDVEAVAQHRAHRTHAQQLRVITQAQITRQASKGLVEHEFAVAVAFEVQRCHSDRDVIPPDAQMQWLPALLRNDAAGAFQGLQPAPAIEGNGVVAHQSAPVLLWNFSDGAVPAGRE